MSLRSKRLAKSLDEQAARFLDSTAEDADLAVWDILGSLAHVHTLADAKLVTSSEAAALTNALTQLHADASAGRLRLESDLEDVHMNVEAQLTGELGDLGRKLHTARSRNDQVALDLRLAARAACLALARETLALTDALLAHADDNGDAVLPGYTHFQVAQPVLLGHHLGAHAERLARDLDRLHDAYRRINVSPLGAGALAGTRHAIQPALTARLLGFDAPFNNSLDAVSDRDFLVEILFDASLLLTHVSGLAEELILFTNPAFAFVELDDAHATGSSLMPQKKNPDVLEVARAKAATLVGALTAALGHLKALPLAYNRDLQEQKRLFLTTLPHAVQTVQAVAGTVAGLTFHLEAMAAAAGVGHADATELADYLVERGVPFRDAHAQAAQLVRVAVEKGVPLSDLTLPAYQKVNPKIGKDLLARLGPRAAAEAKTSPGGTAPAPSQAARRNLTRRLNELRSDFETLAAHVQRAEQSLLRIPKEVKSK